LLESFEKKSSENRDNGMPLFSKIDAAHTIIRMSEQEVIQLFSKIKTEPVGYGVVLIVTRIKDDELFSDWRRVSILWKTTFTKFTGLK